MRFPVTSLAVLAAMLMAPAARAGDDAPPAEFIQNGKLNIALSISQTEMGSHVRGEQLGEKNLFISSQEFTMDGPFQFRNGAIPLNKLNVLQYGERNVSLGAQDGINNDAVINQLGEPGGSDQTEFHHNRYVDEALPGGGVSFEFVSGDVEIAAQYNVNGYHASSSFGRSH